MGQSQGARFDPNAAIRRYATEITRGSRITLGLILASLIVGAAMLMRVESSFRIFGYPGLAMMGFIAAAGGGLTLAWSILRSDMHHDEKPKNQA